MGTSLWPSESTRTPSRFSCSYTIWGKCLDFLSAFFFSPPGNGDSVAYVFLSFLIALPSFCFLSLSLPVDFLCIGSSETESTRGVAREMESETLLNLLFCLVTGSESWDD